MVLPLSDEADPKCWLCHEGFKDVEQLREHQRTAHGDPAGDGKPGAAAAGDGPAPGDVTVF